VNFSVYCTELWTLAVEMIPGKHCDFSTYLAKSANTQSGACAEVQFNDYGTELWSPGSRNVSCAEVNFNDYGTELWSPGSRNVSKKALRFQHLSCQGSESSIWGMCRGAVS
jgi:hypothetical protein